MQIGGCRLIDRFRRNKRPRVHHAKVNARTLINKSRNVREQREADKTGVVGLVKAKCRHNVGYSAGCTFTKPVAAQFLALAFHRRWSRLARSWWFIWGFSLHSPAVTGCEINRRYTCVEQLMFPQFHLTENCFRVSDEEVFSFKITSWRHRVFTKPGFTCKAGV